MRHFPILICAMLVVSLTSCDHTTYVSVRNYKEPCRVSVTYQKSGNSYFDNDTLFLKGIDSSKFDSSLLRVNTSPDSYYFIAPSNKEVVLNPISLGQPIRQVEIVCSPDSLWTVNIWNRKDMKQLKQWGRVKTKGFIFRTSIVIENK